MVCNRREDEKSFEIEKIPFNRKTILIVKIKSPIGEFDFYMIFSMIIILQGIMDGVIQ